MDRMIAAYLVNLLSELAGDLVKAAAVIGIRPQTVAKELDKAVASGYVIKTDKGFFLKN